MELSDREYRVAGIALMLYAESPIDRDLPDDAQQVGLADREVAKSLYYKFLAESAGVKT